MNYVGIDISKLTFDVAIEQSGNYSYYKFSNDIAGFKEFANLLQQNGHWCVMEASGPYYLKLAWHLKEQNINLSIVNPLVIRRFCQMRLMKTKTDKKDAMMIAEYGKAEQPKLWQAEETYMLELRQMHAYVEQLDKSRTGLSGQMESFRQNPAMSKIVKDNIQKMIKTIDKQVADIEQQMEAIIEAHHAEMYKQLKSIPGIGKKTSLMLLVISNGFSKFSNSKQLSSYVGLSPRIFESGTSVKGRARICKMGMKRVRNMLYLCSWSAVKYNQACKELYDRITAKGKPKMVALIAVANKLLKQAFAIATNGTYYEKNYSPNICF